MLKKISELTETTSLDDSSLFVVVHDGETKKITKADVQTIIVGDIDLALDAINRRGGVVYGNNSR